MSGYFELRRNDRGQFSFVLKAGNHEVILTSEVYESRAAAENGIASVQKNSPDAARYERLSAKDGRPYFTLKAANHQVIGISQMYQSEAARDGGIDSVMRNGSTATVKDLTAA
jgi:uncharacterized protein YegP (UPF0339 family)